MDRDMSATQCERCGKTFKAKIALLSHKNSAKCVKLVKPPTT